MSKNDKRTAVILSIIQTFVQMKVKQQKKPYLEVIERLFHFYSGKMSRDEIKEVRKILSIIFSKAVESGYKITPTFVVFFTDHFVQEYLTYVRGERRIAWERAQGFILNHPLHKRFSNSEKSDYRILFESDEFFEHILSCLEAI